MPAKNQYFKKSLSEINPEIDLKVKIIGLVVDKSELSIIVDDGKDKVNIYIDPEMEEKIDIHQLVAVYGTVIPTEDGFEIKADVVQDLTGINLNFYKKMEELYKKWGVYQ
ncbi:MAG: OB-fold nucleic acid binding domain-containing protein [Candidatus Aenigmatarchaeota archaeon]